MPASLRMEIFPSSLPRTIDFYTRVLRFNLLRHEAAEFPADSKDEVDKYGYAYFGRDTIKIGADASHPKNSRPVEIGFRRPPTGVEIVIEVDDIDEERQWIDKQGWKVNDDEDVMLQPWGLRDFRIEDPDGYFIRLTEKGTGHGKADM